MSITRLIGSVLAGFIMAYVLQRYFVGLIQDYITGTDPLLVMAVIVFASGFIAGLIADSGLWGTVAGFIVPMLPPLFIALEAYIRGSEGLETYLGAYASWLYHVFTNPGPITTTPFIIAAIGGLLGGVLTGGLSGEVVRERKIEERVLVPPISQPPTRSEEEVRQGLVGADVFEGETSKPEEQIVPPPPVVDDLRRENVQLKQEIEEYKGQMKKAEGEAVSGPPDVIFNDWLEINGSEYECYALKIAEGKQVTVKINVEEEGAIDFYILSDEMLSRWNKGEKVSDAYVFQDRVNLDVIKWSPKESGEYFFLFDNKRSPEKKKCKVQVLLHNL